MSGREAPEAVVGSFCFGSTCGAFTQAKLETLRADTVPGVFSKQKWSYLHQFLSSDSVFQGMH